MPDDIKKLLADHQEEIKRHFDIVAEDLEKNIIGAMREELDIHGRQITELEKGVKSVKKDLAQVKEDVAVIKVAVGAVPGERPLKQRVGDLEERVEDLEAVSAAVTPMEEE